MLGESFTLHTKVLQQAAAESLERLSEVRDIIQRETEVLESNAQTATNGMSEVATLMRQRREDLTINTEEMRRVGTEAEEMLANRGRDVRDTIDGILERWRGLGDMLAERGETLRETSENAVARADETMQAFDRQTGEFASSADRLERRIPMSCSVRACRQPMSARLICCSSELSTGTNSQHQDLVEGGCRLVIIDLLCLTNEIKKIIKIMI